VVSINNKGKLFLQDSEVEPAILISRLKAITKEKSDTRIFVRGIAPSTMAASWRCWERCSRQALARSPWSRSSLMPPTRQRVVSPPHPQRPLPPQLVPEPTSLRRAKKGVIMRAHQDLLPIALIGSVILHLLLMLAAVFGLPGVQLSRPEVQPTFVVDIELPRVAISNPPKAKGTPDAQDSKAPPTDQPPKPTPMPPPPPPPAAKEEPKPEAPKPEPVKPAAKQPEPEDEVESLKKLLAEKAKERKAQEEKERRKRSRKRRKRRSLSPPNLTKPKSQNPKSPMIPLPTTF
jgi:hypothetical protein